MLLGRLISFNSIQRKHAARYPRLTEPRAEYAKFERNIPNSRIVGSVFVAPIPPVICHHKKPDERIVGRPLNCHSRANSRDAGMCEVPEQVLECVVDGGSKNWAEKT
jgi:hypothetical protein